MTSTSTATDPILRQGDSGTAVTWLQQLLNTKGINIAVDGIFGNVTRAAVVQFQKQSGIATDGIVVSSNLASPSSKWQCTHSTD